MTVERYIEIAVYCVYVVASVVGLIITAIKAKKAKDEAKVAKIKNNVKTEIQTFIQDAEKFKNYSPEEKLMYVVTRTKNINQHVYSEDEIIDLVNKEVEFTNNVNTPETKKGA